MEQFVNDVDLFDQVAFNRNIKEQKNHLPLFKNALKSGYEYLIEQFKAGEDIEILVNKQVWLVDQLLIQASNLHGVAKRWFITNIIINSYTQCSIFIHRPAYFYYMYLVLQLHE